MLSVTPREAATRCPVCLREYDPLAFQVLVPGMPSSFDTVECAERARAALQLERLPQPVLDRLAGLEASLANAHARSELARRRREELEAETARLRGERDSERSQRQSVEAERDELAADRERLAVFLERRGELRREEPAGERRRRREAPRR